MQPHEQKQPSASQPRSADVSRRALLQAGGALAGAALAHTFGAPAIVRAEDKAGSKPLVVGSGAHTYEVVDGWAKLPDNIKFGNTHAVQEAADGRILVHHTGQQSVCIFDPDGKFIEAWGDQYAGAAHGMDLRKEGSDEFLYLAATGQHKVYKTDLKGNVVLTLDYPADAKDASGKPCYNGPNPYVPTFTAFAPNGDFYVTDGYGAGFIHRYNIRGEYQSSFGGRGDAENQTNCPHGIYCDTRDAAKPLLVVADREHHRLQYFTLDGKLDHLVTNTPPENGGDDAKFRRPCHFSLRGDELLVPDLRGRVTVLDKANDVIVQLGDNPNAGQRANNGVRREDLTAGAFRRPHGATWDRAGNIYVAEWLPYGRVTKLRRVEDCDRSPHSPVGWVFQPRPSHAPPSRYATFEKDLGTEGREGHEEGNENLKWWPVRPRVAHSQKAHGEKAAKKQAENQSACDSIDRPRQLRQTPAVSSHSTEGFAIRALVFCCAVTSLTIVARADGPAESGPNSPRILFYVKLIEVSLTRLKELGIDDGAALAHPASENAYPSAVLESDAKFVQEVERWKERRLVTVLAESEATTLSGVPAYLHQGGSVAVPAPVSRRRPIGARIDFVPRLQDDGAIKLDLRFDYVIENPELSVFMSGTRYPGFTTRSANGYYELKPGQILVVRGIVEVRAETYVQRGRRGRCVSARRANEVEMILLARLTVGDDSEKSELSAIPGPLPPVSPAPVSDTPSDRRLRCHPSTPSPAR